MNTKKEKKDYGKIFDDNMGNPLKQIDELVKQAKELKPEKKVRIEEITPKIYTKRTLLGKSNISVTLPSNYKCFYLQAIFEYSPKLKKVFEKNNYEIVLKVNSR